MSSSHGRHQIVPHNIHTSAKKTVYPLPQQLAEKVIKDRGRNAYVVVFDTGKQKESPSVDEKRVLKTSSWVFNETNIKRDNENASAIKGKPVGNEDVKINFSNLAFDDYDSTKTAVRVFSDDDIDCEIDKCFDVKQDTDEGYDDSKSYSTHNPHEKTSEPIAGYMFIPPTDPVHFYKPINSTPSTKFDLSGSSGYYSGSSGGYLSDFNTPSPVPTSDQGYHHPAARQIILVPSPVTALDGRPIMPHQYSNISPMSSLADGFNNIARIESPTVFSTKKFTGADAFSLPEEPHQKPKNPKIDNNKQGTENNYNNNCNSLQDNSQNSSTPFKWEQVDNRIVIKAPNKKPLDLSLPNINRLKADHALQNSSKKSQSPHLKANTTSQKIGDVVIHCDMKQKETVVMVQQGNSTSYAIGHLPVSEQTEEQSLPKRKPGSHKEPSALMYTQELEENTDSHDSNYVASSQESFGVASSQESSESVACTDKEILDTSLTNIQWLGGIQLKNPTKADRPDPAKPPHSSTPVQWKRMSTGDIYRIAAECGRTKRPPFSYMTLIQMALHSKEDKRMRLRDICAWIENTFPYYKHTAKPGWRNSIRHNLSLYSIFERETTKKHGSYWTVRDDCPEKLKSCPGRDGKKDEVPNRSEIPSQVIPVIPSFLPQSTASTTCTGTQSRKRAGPQPILPRPSPLNNGSMQTYALIPIQNVGNSGQNQNVMPLSSSQESTNSTNSEGSQSDSKKGSKTRRIAPKLSPLLLSPPNLVKQAWIDSQFVSSSEGEGERNIQTEENKSENETCAKKPKTGLPQPKLYSKNPPPVKRTKSRRKQQLVPKERELMQDSTDEESEYAKFVSRLEEDLPTPMRKLLDENVKDDDASAITSTPLKNSGISSQMLSPFSGLTPFKTENILDNSFLECLRESPMTTSKKSPTSSSGSSPKLDLNLFGLTPIKLNNGSLNSDNSYNLSKFLAEYPLDANMVDEADVLPVDLSVLNWSSMHNMAPLDNS